jgi:hypothetical protein
MRVTSQSWDDPLIFSPRGIPRTGLDRPSGARPSLRRHRLLPRHASSAKSVSKILVGVRRGEGACPAREEVVSKIGRARRRRSLAQMPTASLPSSRRSALLKLDEPTPEGRRPGLGGADLAEAKTGEPVAIALTTHEHIAITTCNNYFYCCSVAFSGKSVPGNATSHDLPAERSKVRAEASIAPRSATAHGRPVSPCQPKQAAAFETPTGNRMTCPASTSCSDVL